MFVLRFMFEVRGYPSQQYHLQNSNLGPLLGNAICLTIAPNYLLIEFNINTCIYHEFSFIRYILYR